LQKTSLIFTENSQKWVFGIKWDWELGKNMEYSTIPYPGVEKWPGMTGLLYNFAN
jgi:hypothetical protein